MEKKKANREEEMRVQYEKEQEILNNKLVLIYPGSVEFLPITRILYRR